MQHVAGLPYAEIQFTRDGGVHDDMEASGLSAMVGEEEVTDLLVVSHGWNNDMAEARGLYARLLQRLRAQLDAGAVPRAADRTYGVAAILWPSKKFAEDELIPSGAASIDGLVSDAALLEQVDNLKSALADPGTDASLEEIKPLLAQLEDDPAARRAIVETIRGVLPQRATDAEDASDEFFAEDPGELMDRLAEVVLAAPNLPTGGGGAAAFEVGGGGAATATPVTGATGEAQGLGEVLGGARAAARRLLNFATYYVMKDRAGLVGRTGVLEVLKRLHAQRTTMRMHLVGHSFGARLVTSAAAGWGPGPSPIASLGLLQAAFSHNGFAPRWNGRDDGAFRGLVTGRLVSGPVVITCTKNDRAVGLAYPIASRIARQAAAALGGPDDPYGGLGRNGAQRTPEATDGFLLPVGGTYAFAAGRIHNLVADDFVADHGDIASDAVAYALLAAVTAT